MHMYNILRLWILDLDFSINKIQNEDATNIKSHISMVDWVSTKAGSCLGGILHQWWRMEKTAGANTSWSQGNLQAGGMTVI